MDRCQWKLIEPYRFTLGVEADRCGEVADVRILRPQRKKDLYLCESHLNGFIQEWGLRQEVQILCKCEEETRSIKCHKCHGDGLAPSWPSTERCDYCDGRGWWWGKQQYTCDNPDCRKCIQDDPKTWGHK